MRLKDVMTDEVIAVEPDASVLEVALIMKKENIGSVPICEGTDVVGMITDRDIVLRVVCEKKDPEKVKCREVMTERLVVGKPQMNVETALELMGDAQVRRLPVVEEGHLVGFITLGALAVNDYFRDESGEALAEISTPNRSW
ncbi:MAG TPA: CBS domain-containing protein [Clostridia bacterium]|jgi:CBS domain-containing protein|nr:CBS domain-containing protein [Clostridia bacterium]